MEQEYLVKASRDLLLLFPVKVRIEFFVSSLPHFANGLGRS
jgi:hypothetical protein